MKYCLHGPYLGENFQPDPNAEPSLCSRYDIYKNKIVWTKAMDELEMLVQEGKDVTVYVTGSPYVLALFCLRMGRLQEMSCNQHGSVTLVHICEDGMATPTKKLFPNLLNFET